jgi:hypothetical protein
LLIFFLNEKLRHFNQLLELLEVLLDEVWRRDFEDLGHEEISLFFKLVLLGGEMLSHSVKFGDGRP